MIMKPQAFAKWFCIARDPERDKHVPNWNLQETPQSIGHIVMFALPDLYMFRNAEKAF
jgi:hypothetical protein